MRLRRPFCSGDFRVCPEGVESQERHAVLAEGKGGVDELRPVGRKACFVANFLGDAFGGFLDDVKIILLQQLGAAGPQDVDVDAAFFEIGAQPVRSALWVGQGLGRGTGLDGTAVSQLVGKGKNFIKVLALGIKLVCGIRVADGVHGFLDESDNQISAAVCLLPLPERLVEAVTFRHIRQGIGDA
jgi:hypothetical protein